MMFQSEVQNPKNTETNKFFSSKYAPLPDVINHIKPTLPKYGLSYFQSVGGDGENISVTTILMHNSGEWIESDPLKIKNQEQKGVNLAQAAGISITYAKRYSLCSILGISSEDDTDGNYSNCNHDKSTQNNYINNKKITNNSNDINPVCAECNKEITAAEHDYSIKKFQKPLCRACQDKHKVAS